MAGKGGETNQMLTRIKQNVSALLRDEEGASLVEYILLVALIAVVCIAAVTLLGKAASTRFQSTANSING
jgi:pilus assembly protein Flp/PilA